MEKEVKERWTVQFLPSAVHSVEVIVFKDESATLHVRTGMEAQKRVIQASSGKAAKTKFSKVFVPKGEEVTWVQTL